MYVADSNVVISSLLAGGVPYRVFFLNYLVQRHVFIAPEFLWVEVENHKEELIKESKLEEQTFKDMILFLKEEITIIPATHFLDMLPKAKEMLSTHPKDSMYLALALKTGSKIMSGDKTLKKLCPDNVVTPRKVLDELVPGKE
jgi:predicted nucleic acid-binding protein